MLSRLEQKAKVYHRHNPVSAEKLIPRDLGRVVHLVVLDLLALPFARLLGLVGVAITKPSFP